MVVGGATVVDRGVVGTVGDGVERGVVGTVIDGAVDELAVVGDAVTVTTVGVPLMPLEQPATSSAMAVAAAVSATEAFNLSLVLDMVPS
jgi:hypothetical protein